MQSIAEIAEICQRRLDVEEAYELARDEDPTAGECFANCIHAAACERALGVAGKYEAEETDETVRTEGLGAKLDCGECTEYEDAYCPMSWSGTMRCQGPRRGNG